MTAEATPAFAHLLLEEIEQQMEQMEQMQQILIWQAPFAHLLPSKSEQQMQQMQQMQQILRSQSICSFAARGNRAANGANAANSQVLKQKQGNICKYEEYNSKTLGIHMV